MHIKNRYNKFIRKARKQKKAIKYLIKSFPQKKNPIKEDYIDSLGIYLFYWKYWDWSKLDNDEYENLGDYLSKVVVSHFMIKKKGEINLKSHTLYAIGSILGMRCQDAIVWGSGILNTSKHRMMNIKFSSLDIRAVRGPKTRQELLKLGKNCPAIYGDPAILMPEIFVPKIQTKKHKITLIRHYADENIIPDNFNINVLDIITKDYENFITEICQSELVISSSLHGIILAETYGIPAMLLLPKGANTFKYEDWYSSTDRFDVVIAHSIEEALTLKPMVLPDLSKMQKDLMNTFPL